MNDLHVIERQEPENLPRPPPLGERPSPHPLASIRASQFGP